MADFFRVEGLPAVKHTVATRAKLSSLNGSNKSEYIRNALLHLADTEGFSWSGSKPDYVDSIQWLEYQEYQDKSIRSQKSNRVDYDYLIAFWYLKDKFSDLSASVILRRAILQAS